MSYAYTPYLFPSLFATVICWGMMFFLWRYRSRKGNLILLFLTGCASLWALGYTFEIAATSLAAKVFWAKCQYFVIPVIPTLFLVFTLVYTHREKWLLSVRYLLFVFPVLMPVLAVTTEWHGLLWKSYILSLDAPFPN